MEREPIKGLYAGSFDPITRGHMEVIFDAAVKVDELIILLAVNPDKQGSMFLMDERNSLIEAAIQDAIREVEADLKSSIMEKEAVRRIKSGAVKIKIDNFTKKDELTITYAIKHEARQLFRGVRPFGDFEKEVEMANLNKALAQKEGYAISTSIVPTPNPKYVFISSSNMKLLARLGAKDAIEEGLFPSTAEAVMQRVKELDTKEKLGLGADGSNRVAK